MSDIGSLEVYEKDSFDYKTIEEKTNYERQMEEAWGGREIPTHN